jgi:death-on-curing protein
VRRLTPKQILLIHDELIEIYGGSHGVRDENLLESAIYQPYVSYGGVDLYVTIFDKAAALLRSLIKNHPFVDGNKRTAIVSVQIMLEENSYKFSASIDTTYNFLIDVANKNRSVEQISVWLKTNSRYRS